MSLRCRSISFECHETASQVVAVVAQRLLCPYELTTSFQLGINAVITVNMLVSGGPVSHRYFSKLQKEGRIL